MLPLALLLAGCERVGFAVANLPADLGRYQVVRDIAYGSRRWQRLDVYSPIGGDARKRDTIVFFYGGRWTTGAKSDYRFVAQAFVAKGFNVVIPDYAKYPDVKFPVFVEDGAKAVAWTHDHISGYNGDPARIHVAGHSAGAHIGALIASDPHYLAAEGKTPTEVIASFAGLAGPYAFTPDEPDLMDMFGPPDLYPRMQVPTFISGKEPPMFLLWGQSDTTVKQVNLDKLQAAILNAHGAVESKIYPGADHIGVLSALSWINPQRLTVLDDMVRFFAKPRKP